MCHRERILDGKSDRSNSSSQQNFPVKLTVEIIRDVVLDSHGFTVSSKQPLLVRDVTAGKTNTCFRQHTGKSIQ